MAKNLTKTKGKDSCYVIHLEKGAMGRLESELTKACLAKVGLTEATVYPLIILHPCIC